jgi:alpha-beta hydrolase superfamily lysophospholipase
VLAPFTARDGENLALYEWPLNDWTSQPGRLENPRGVVLIVHGLGEHAFRYDHIATRLMNWGFVVRAYDQRGHGQSGGGRGMLPDDSALLDDLAEVVDDTRQRCLPVRRGGASLPLILLGHSMGGVIASRFVSLGMRPVEGLVLSSPAIDSGLNLIQKSLLAVLPSVAPNMSLANGLDARFLSHDAEVVEKYQADPLVHDRVSPRLAKFITTAGKATLAAAEAWSTPTLLLYAGADRLVDPAGSASFARRVACSPDAKPGTLSARCFDNLYHEIFNERQSGQVFRALEIWLEARFS